MGQWCLLIQTFLQFFDGDFSETGIEACPHDEPHHATQETIRADHIDGMALVKGPCRGFQRTSEMIRVRPRLAKRLEWCL
jgi:hypothetical protein